MKQLNKKSNYIFLKLLIKLGQEQHVKLESKGFMPLDLEFLQPVQTDQGEGKLYSLSHSFVLNGDLMRDPEMCFIVVKGTGASDTLIFPQMYQLDSMGLYEESVHISNGQVTGYIPLWQQGHCSFANIWLKNILEQGFLR